LVTGFSKPVFHGFVTLAEAEAYMRDNEVEDYNHNIKQGAGTTTTTTTTTPKKGKIAYYAVANGHKTGIRECY
jgi:viroplasmin and RNaseH domain-containing protein